MAEKKTVSNKAAKVKPATKKAAVKPAEQKADLSKLSDSNKIEAIVDSKHMMKGSTYSGIGRETAEILVKEGLVKLI